MTPTEKIKKAHLEVPPSFAVRWCVVRLGGTNIDFALTAALGLCIRGVGRSRIPWNPSDPASYGAAVMDEMHERGVDQDVLFEVAGRAYAMMAASMVQQSDVSRELGNSRAQEEPTSE